MAVKNALPCSFNIIASWNGSFYSDYPAGDKPSGYQTAPTILDTDIVSGSMTGGENNLGAYLSLFGYSFGRSDQLGTASGARVYMRDPAGDNAWHEVANYRALLTSRTFAVNQVVQIICQVGALGGSQTNGRALDVKVTVNGVDTNVMTGQFTLQPGDFYFAATTGNDGTGAKNNIALPFRYVQYWTGAAFTGIWAPGNIQAGDTIVIRGGSWSDATGFETRWCRFRQHTGTTPNGTAGNGYIHFVAYPGPILGHAREVVHHTAAADTYGGIHGVGSANSDLGYGRFWSVSGLEMECVATAYDCPINMQSSSQTTQHDVRIFDNECGPWPASRVAPSNAKAAGIAGNTYGGSLKFNYCHDIDCEYGSTHTALENHGIYLDGSQHSARSIDVSYNWIKDIPGGSGIQTYNNVAADTIRNISIHHNFVDTPAKYGINLAVAESVNCYNNMVIDALVSIRWDTPQAAPTHTITHNTVRQARGPYGMIWNSGGPITTGTIKVQHNVFVMAAGRADTTWNYVVLNGGDTTTTIRRNVYYDEAGVKNAASALDNDGTYPGIYGDPLFTSVPTDDYTCGASGSGRALCTDAEYVAVATDFYGIARPVTDTGAPGATKNDIGAMQGTGT